MGSRNPRSDDPFVSHPVRYFIVPREETRGKNPPRSSRAVSFSTYWGSEVYDGSLSLLKPRSREPASARLPGENEMALISIRCHLDAAPGRLYITSILFGSRRASR